MNIKERVESLKLNIKQHQDQIKILLKEIRDLENYKTISNNNFTISIDNNFIDKKNNTDKKPSKNENLNKFI